jgi:hypothetical protein
MADHRQTIRTLHRHDWNGAEDWVKSLDDLSRLSDPEIARIYEDDIARPAANQNWRLD